MTNRTPPSGRSAIEKPNIIVIKLEMENQRLQNKVQILEDEKKRLIEFLELYDCEEFQKSLKKFRKNLFK